MSPFNPINKTPGVYIEEVPVPGPIAGVATSVAAFIGPALNGPINEPTQITNWTQFVNTFGDAAVTESPYIINPQIYVTYAVRGFFTNGGSNCYFVRTSTAARASLTLNDRSGGGGAGTLVVTAKQEGTGGNAITVEVQDATTANTTAPQVEVNFASATNNTVTLTNAADGASFVPGDIVFLDDGTNSERAEIAGISGLNVTLKALLANNLNAGTMRLADLQAGQTRFRVDSAAGISVGSVLLLDQGGTNEEVVVKKVTGRLVDLEQGLANAYTLAAGDPAVTVVSQEFTLVVVVNGAPEVYAQLSMDPRHSRYVESMVSSPNVSVARIDPPNPTPPPDNRPAVLAATNLAGGTADNIAAIGANEYLDALDALKRVDEVTLICIPDRTDQAVQAAMITHCEQMADRFAILDPQPNASLTAIRTQRDALGSDNGFAAIYYPRIVVNNPVNSAPIIIPPSGHLAGLFARVDDTRGVHKAPANEQLRGVLSVERQLADDEQGPLNEQGINVLRVFRGRGVVVWGARTISTSTQWRYVNVRRLLLYIEESLQEGTQFAVFEPNAKPLWEKLKRQITGFLTRVWNDGALVGTAPDEGFEVRIDEELNPPETVALGQLVIEVRVYPAPPAEFIVFRVIQEPGGPSVEE